MSSPAEDAVTFPCGDDQLMGVLHRGSGDNEVAFVFVVGGPQYRVGSHRMFVALARGLASAGHTVLRFDCRGMGDSDGVFGSFKELDDDIRSAIDFVTQSARVRRIVLLGLCDGASACAMYVPADARVSGLVLLNPWVRTAPSAARTLIRHYYGKRIFQTRFWKSIFAGEVNLVRSAAGLLTGFRWSVAQSNSKDDFVDRMRMGLADFEGSILLVLSSDDLVGREFSSQASSKAWSKIWSDRTKLIDLAAADHTLSTRGSLAAALGTILEWIGDIERSSLRPACKDTWPSP